MIAFPYVTSITIGALLFLQIALAFMVSIKRGATEARGPIGIGDGGQEVLARSIRRHQNLAENSAIFAIGFMLLEISRFNHRLLIVLCVTFVAVRLFHALGLSQPNTVNAMRLVGGMGTYICGLVLSSTLIWIGINAAQKGH